MAKKVSKRREWTPAQVRPQVGYAEAPHSAN